MTTKRAAIEKQSMEIIGLIRERNDYVTFNASLISKSFKESGITGPNDIVVSMIGRALLDNMEDIVCFAGPINGQNVPLHTYTKELNALSKFLTEMFCRKNITDPLPDVFQTLTGRLFKKQIMTIDEVNDLFETVIPSLNNLIHMANKPGSNVVVYRPINDIKFTDDQDLQDLRGQLTETSDDHHPKLDENSVAVFGIVSNDIFTNNGITHDEDILVFSKNRLVAFNKPDTLVLAGINTNQPLFGGSPDELDKYTRAVTMAFGPIASSDGDLPFSFTLEDGTVFEQTLIDITKLNIDAIDHITKQPDAVIYRRQDSECTMN